MSFDEVIKLVSIIVSVLSLLGVGTIMTMFWRDKHDKREKEQEENSQLREEKKKEELKGTIGEAINESINPIVQDLNDIKSDLEKLKRGVQVNCRNDLEDMYKKAEQDGYCSDEDKKRFEATYQAYHNLGKNGVMDEKHRKLLAMPEHAPVTIRKPRAKLNEGIK